MTVLEIARDALATGPVCDACLGRLVADRSFGLANAERGRALRTTVALEDDEPYEEPEDCWVCEGESNRIDTWADRAVRAVAGYDFDTYQAGTRVPPMLEENDVLLREDVGLPEDAGEPLKAELNREVGKRFGRQVDAEVDFERPDVQLLLDLGTDEVELQVNSAFVYGRYKKLERDIPQTKWPCNECGGTGLKRGAECPGCDGTGFRYDESVEQLTAPPVVEAYDGESATFHGAGREDVDALMLGTGRPFVIEVEDPHTREVDPDRLQEAINDYAEGKVEVTDLAIPTYEMVKRVKEHDAAKTYRMAVEFDEPVTEADLQAALDTLRGATITQRTPQRVDHRRADIDRTREVYEIEGERDDETHATIELDGEGGLYVKELVSGDEGRTEPSLSGLLGVGAVVTALDVLAVEGEDEPFLVDEYLAE
ncbi:tRNA pseudouridine(54/55) synthase Pus10 [Halapricum hydrolyticum]|uniref:tRNA pseudouridine synthase Pus10 n=1 Tax=Halapricum hydrolyticum TaxID=2979991 RepID=A0AAE3IA78_9EURY|nr:tRNA pseudouridine(54/55) synthase Pus10 [Halapricum hydrolyticum]MCU4717052.1 tRNA pseudouridine(54/55) synthase Pus10 [Halapricum hydrolyticum]MCU4725979.1 tRNA pseudouridine(54/55) synthase Pus10 [Halapricum hydrolyticum]